MRAYHRLAFLPLALCAVGCASMQTLAGVDGAKTATDGLRANIEAAAAQENTRRAAIRDEQRLALVRLLVGGGKAEWANPPLDYQVCTPYASFEAASIRARLFADTAKGLKEIVGDSPASLVGLVDSLQRMPAAKGLSPSEPSRPVYDIQSLKPGDCFQDMQAGSHSISASADFQGETVFTAIMGAVTVFRELVLPVVKAGLTRADRQKRLEALRAWAERPDDNTAPSLTGLLNELDASLKAADEQSKRGRLLAAGGVHLAWEALRTDAFQKMPAEVCPIQTRESGSRLPNAAQGADAPRSYFETKCITDRLKLIDGTINTFLAAAKKYDAAFDADPLPPLAATRVAAERLRQLLAGNPTPEDAVAMNAAAFSAAFEWLKFLESAEQLSDDDAKKKKLSDAWDKLVEEMF